MLSPDVLVLEALRFFLSQAQDFACPLGKLLESLSLVHLFFTPLFRGRGWNLVLCAAHFIIQHSPGIVPSCTDDGQLLCASALPCGKSTHRWMEWVRNCRAISAGTVSASGANDTSGCGAKNLSSSN